MTKDDVDDNNDYDYDDDNVDVEKRKETVPLTIKDVFRVFLILE